MSNSNACQDKPGRDLDQLLLCIALKRYLPLSDKDIMELARILKGGPYGKL